MHDCRNCVYGWEIGINTMLCAAANGFVPVERWHNNCEVWKYDRDKDEYLAGDDSA